MHDSTKFKFKIKFEDVRSGDVVAVYHREDGDTHVFVVDEVHGAWFDNKNGEITVYKADDEYDIYSQTEPEVILPTERGVYVFPDWPNVGQGPIAQRGMDHWTMLYADGSTSLTPNDTMKAHVRSWGITKLVPQK